MKTTLILLVFLVGTSTLQSFGQANDSLHQLSEPPLETLEQERPPRRYSPFIAGLANYVLFSSGYFYVGEPVRGAIVLGSGFLSMGVFMYGVTRAMSVDITTGESPGDARVWLISGLLSTGLIKLWSIYDVIRIARMKNAANEQNRLSLKLSPETITIAPNSNPGYGLKLSLRF